MTSFENDFVDNLQADLQVHSFLVVVDYVIVAVVEMVRILVVDFVAVGILVANSNSEALRTVEENV